jgi:biopolymer transport protein ExbB
MNALYKFFVHDWWIAIPMLLMSLVGIALLIWRGMRNLNATTNLNEFLPQFQQRLEKDGVDGALRFCKSREDVIPKQLYVPGLEVAKQGQGLAAVRRAMANAIELEILPDLNFLLPSILAIAKIATMVGLLGTVISMINTFSEIGKSAGAGGVSSQAESIGLALFATAMGLITAIPLVFAHVLFKAWVAKLETKMKSSAIKLQLLLQAAKNPGSTSTSASGSSAGDKTAKPSKNSDSTSPTTTTRK